MKKIITTLLIILAIATAFIYILIPTTLIIASTTTINVTENGYRKFVIDDSSDWQKWWPGKEVMNQHESFIFNNYQYTVINKSINVAEVFIIKNKDTLQSKLIFVPLKLDSMEVIWKTSFASGKNPLKRLQQYKMAKEIKTNFSDLLNHLKKFLENKETIYSFNIQRTKVKDSILLSTKFTTNNYPAIPEIYKSINDLKTAIAAKNARETGYPMLHVRVLNSSQFETMVAIPINKEIITDYKFSIKKMILGNLLVTDVKGGSTALQRAYNALDTYIIDYRLTSPAMPFESLITNRFTEPDTSKWQSKVYYPIF